MSPFSLVFQITSCYNSLIYSPEVFSLEFYVNHPVLFLLAGVLILAVLGQSLYFLVKAMKRSKEIGMDQTKIRKTIKTAAIFTVAPAVSIVISVITLSKSLGIPLPWLRLSVVGSLSYEAIAASNALSSMGLELGKVNALTAQQYVLVGSTVRSYLTYLKNEGRADFIIEDNMLLWKAV